MKTYQSYLKTVVDKREYRENVEWGNFWIDSAREVQTERILLIGDSNLRNIRHRLADFIKLPVDFIGSSSNLEDVLFVNQIDAFFKDIPYKYSAIFVQFSHHGVIGLDGGEFCVSDIERYKESYSALTYFLHQFADKIILMTVFDSVEIKKKYPALINRLESRVGKFGRKLLYKYFSYTVGIESRNQVSRWKNDTIRDLAKRENLTLFDVYALLSTKNYKYVDMIHYEPAAYMDIVKHMASLLRNQKLC